VATNEVRVANAPASRRRKSKASEMLPKVWWEESCIGHSLFEAIKAAHLSLVNETHMIEVATLS
jgi:hypothetical protein